MKIFNKNLSLPHKNIRKSGLNTKLGVINNMKYLPAFSKEWKNIIYSFNKNNLKNLPANTININKVIKSYFNLFFKDREFLGKTKFLPVKVRRNFLRKIFVSDAEIKFTNNEAKITLYTFNKEKKALNLKYHTFYKKIAFDLFQQYNFLYSYYIKNIYYFFNKKYNIYNQLFFVRDFVNKKKYVKFKLRYLHIFSRLNNLALKKIWSILIKDRALYTATNKYLIYLRKYNLLYCLNQFKFNKLRLLSKLTYFLEKIIGKKLQYKIVNLKSITYHPDIFTDILALKIKKDRTSPHKRMTSILHKVRLPVKNTIQERTKAQKSDKIDVFRNRFRDLKIISNIDNGGLRASCASTRLLDKIFVCKATHATHATQQRNELFRSEANAVYGGHSTKYGNSLKKIHNLVFNSIGYKNLSGIRLKVSGRLTQRYRADRAIKAIDTKGGLKNIDSSFKGLSSISFRANNSSNLSYSWTKSKRRIGSFAVKGWIGGK